MPDNNMKGYNPGEIEPIPTRPWQPPDTPPCYLPQKDSKVPAKDMIMGPIGPWATGLVDWTPLAGMTGTRPVVDKYSITKYSTGEWRQHNAQILSGEALHKADILEMDAKNALTQAYAKTDQDYNDNTGRLKERAQEVYRWKADVEYACKAMADEIVILEEMRQRLKSASSVLLLPEAIARECLDLRSNRLEPDLVRDAAEEEIIKEMSLIGAIRRLYAQTLAEIDEQMANNKSAKARIEFDWSDKTVTYDTDSVNIGINNKTPTILLKPGAVRLSDGQSSLGYWEHFCRENIDQAEAMRQQSMDRRSSIDALLINTARDLRTQADRVDQSLAEKAACTDELRIRLEDQLKKTLQKLADVETLCNNLKTGLRQLELAMKVAQTRLDNRGFTGRPNVEQCRDTPHMGLLEEVNTLGKSIATLKDKLDRSNLFRSNLLQNRGSLERELIIKKKSLYIDRERCGAIRSFYPSAAKLSGHE